ncbi:transcription-repair coupling factor [Mangrovibacillus cuniculi]|uniref:Transcription-repair-coupling factor n=2 Tax=Mangrovibacillus cuniculi TaxID=2593652 RepID=A0A7S8HH54_9BACI|nr:transcription-repair coupling factor [Mangrovibacillus cuniculi]QPC48472.1 transcription-repair coupling factor [Mangrovibacillus cuniculi]
MLVNHVDVQSIMDGIDEGLNEQLVAGLSGSARAAFIATTYTEKKKSMVVVTHNLLQAQKLQEDLLGMFGEEKVFLYPADEVIASEISIASPELRAERLTTLQHLATGIKGIYIVPHAGMRRILPPVELWSKLYRTVNVGQDLDVSQFLLSLVDMGYERVQQVDQPGEFSVRGGIIDVYPPTEDNPVRLDLFDTEVDSIRSFSLEDQRSLHKIDQLTIGPATEMPITSAERDRLQVELQKALSKSLKKTSIPEVKEALSQSVTYEIEQLKEGQTSSQLMKYAALAYEGKTSLLDYFPEDSIVVLDELSRIYETAEKFEKEEAEWYTSLMEEGKILHDIPLAHSLASLLVDHDLTRIYLSLFLRKVAHTSPQNIVNISCKQMQHFHGQSELLATEIKRWKKAKYTVLFFAPDESRKKKIKDLLDDIEVDVAIQGGSEFHEGVVQILQGQLQTGFEIPALKLAVITEEELVFKRAKKAPRRQKMSNAERIKSYSELKNGDYIVHVNHGIGRYLGIETLEINGVHKDYLHLRYSGDDKLYVPVEQIDLVQKYVGSEGKEPKIYKLGGSDWKRVKNKVEKSVQDIADDLIKLYAEREAARGYAFSPDGEMQREFESSFPYQETEDQERSIQEIKYDMERERPMDRLLCGDVGYGKTEVAIRAVFKAIADGKQVAFLVPTTILAQQHYETMKERFQGFPVNVGVLSRFRTRKEQQETMKGLSEGTVDVVVGTHRLLSKEIKYKDLGLLIIDEEQRFGVTHKEKIKQLKTNIDVLTLTATPIPRTLHMSMLGVRDLSVIETPPENRFPVQTYVMEYNGAMVKEAIERELARDGQVYFLYNRVEDIARKAEEISMLVPDARVTYAHGQMTEQELEAVILSFLEGEYDVLVTTTIIETGVDIPNVNTMIVHQADRMGLSQLYQLRGRVGRSSRVAYAYFTYQKDKVLNEVAEKRLQAIKEFTELGSGFKIAMRDLSIRGAGNLLGAQQHGFIDSVGFDLYSQMLQEAIETKRGNGVKEEEKSNLELDIQVDAYIPDTYISDSAAKINMYKRFRGLETIQDLQDLKDELLDRFGDYPQEVADLFRVSEIRIYGRFAKLEKIKQDREAIHIFMSEEGSKEVDGSKVFELTSNLGRDVGLGMEGQQMKLSIYLKRNQKEPWFDRLYQLVKLLPDTKKEVEPV